jgi:hypothetical protein
LNPDTDPNPAFYVNPDPESGVGLPKTEKNTDEKYFLKSFYKQNLQFTYS